MLAIITDLTEAIKNNNLLDIKNYLTQLAKTSFFKYKKPIIMFDSKLSPMGMIKDIFKVRSTNDCKQALKIICSNFIPTYNDFDSILIGAPDTLSLSFTEITANQCYGDNILQFKFSLYNNRISNESQPKFNMT